MADEIKSRQFQFRVAMQASRQRAAEETVARIIEVAEEQFRRIGYAKTAVADIPRARMSPANVYRSPFEGGASRRDAEKCLAEVEVCSRHRRRGRPAGERLERSCSSCTGSTRALRERAAPPRHGDGGNGGEGRRWRPHRLIRRSWPSSRRQECVGGIRGGFGRGRSGEPCSPPASRCCTLRDREFAHRDLEKDARRVVRFLLRRSPSRPRHARRNENRK